MAGTHAYMIMAHTQFESLTKLIALLDHERNDIYLHVDIKAGDFDIEMVRAAAVRSRLVLVPRRDVRWGSFSEIECELALLRAATETQHDYYHLLSGMDLPLHSAEAILQFFDQNTGEYVHFSRDDDVPGFESRVTLFHFLQERLTSSRSTVVADATALLNRCLLLAQRGLRVNRLRQTETTLKIGSQWFSITDEFARYVLAEDAWIRRTFGSSHCGSELFMQTIAFNSKFREHVRSSNLRLVDWSRGTGQHPHVWRSEDLEELMSSSCLFARKFDSRVDGRVIDEVAVRSRRRNAVELHES